MKLALFILLTLLILLGIQNSANANTVTVNGIASGILGCEPGKDPSQDPQFKGFIETAHRNALDNARVECGTEAQAISAVSLSGSCRKQAYFHGAGAIEVTDVFECLGTPVCYWPKANIHE